MTEQALIERASRAVMVDVGPGYGALVISTQPEMLGQELEISPAIAPELRQHVYVLMRSLPRGTAYAAVFPRLRAGEYLLGAAVEIPVRRVLVQEGTVTAATWDSVEPRHSPIGPRGNSASSISNPISLGG